ncbi:MAG: hypothetical protein ACXW0Q_13465 [Methylovulum sp.]
MKKSIRFIALAATLITGTTALSSSLPVTEKRAVEFSIDGIGSEIDAAAYSRLRSIISHAVSNNLIDKFIVYGYSSQNGFSGCVEERAENTIPNEAFEQWVSQLNTVHPKSGTTYSFNRIDSCLAIASATDKPITVQIAKPDDRIACVPDSGESLTDMHKELGAIAVYSAAKELPDGLLNAAPCGFETGQYNVYEIAATDLDPAIKSGFTTWPETAVFLSNQSPTPLQFNTTNNCTSTMCTTDRQWTTTTSASATGCTSYSCINHVKWISTPTGRQCVTC